MPRTVDRSLKTLAPQRYGKRDAVISYCNNSLLQKAVDFGSKAAVDVLLSSGAKLKLEDIISNLAEAIVAKDVEMLRLLVECTRNIPAFNLTIELSPELRPEDQAKIKVLLAGHPGIKMPITSGILISATGDVYEGAFLNGERHGKGSYTYRNGGMYRGEWRGGKIEGYGALTNADGSKYIGNWKDGRRHGEGFNIYADGAEYIGLWKDGKRHGRGTLINTDGSRYEGSWVNGKMEGRGVHVHVNGDREEAVFRGDKKGNLTRVGRFIRFAKRVFSGRIVDRELTHSNGDRYVGQQKRGEAHGFGINMHVDGGRYVGEWKNGQEHGFGTAVYADGTIYKGEWRSGDRNGFGVMEYAIGVRYKGEWRNGQEYGFGVMEYPNGYKYTGELRDGKSHGLGGVNIGDNYYYGNYYGNLLVGDNSLKQDRSERKILLLMDGDHSKNSLHIEGNISSFYGVKTTVKDISKEDATPLKIKDYLCLTKDGDNQVVVHIRAHGSKKGRLSDEENILARLKVVSDSINEYNEGLEDGKKVKRVKLSFSSCYGDAVFSNKSSKFLGLIEGFVGMGVDVHTSAIESSSESIASVSNGKNFSGPTSEGTRIVKRLFSKPGSSSILKQQSKYSDFLPPKDGGINRRSVAELVRVETFPDASSFLSGMSREKIARVLGGSADMGLQTIKGVGGEYIGSLNENGERHGYGILCYSDGSTYLGKFECDKRCGEGTFIDSKGNKHEGNWSNVNGEEVLAKVNGDREVVTPAASLSTSSIIQHPLEKIDLRHVSEV